MQRQNLGKGITHDGDNPLVRSHENPPTFIHHESRGRLWQRRVWQLRNKGKMQESGQKEKSKKRGKERKMKPREHHIAYYSIFYGEKSTVSVVLFYSMFFHFMY